MTAALAPRALPAGTAPPIGTIFFPRGHALVNKLTEFGEWEDYVATDHELPWIPSHVYIVVGPPKASGEWDVVEALSKGVTRHYVPARTKDTHAFIPGNADICLRVADQAIQLAIGGILYDWKAIARQVVRGLGAMVGAERQVNWCLRYVFRNDNPHRMICSEVGARCLEAAVGHSIRELLPEWDVTPLDLYLFLSNLA